MKSSINACTEQNILPVNEEQLNADSYLVEAIANDLEVQALNMIKEGIKNPRFSLNVPVDEVKKEVSEGWYPVLLLAHHHLVLPKEKFSHQLIEDVKQVFEVDNFMEFNNELIFEVYLHEGPFAETIASTITEINENIGVVAESLIEKLDLKDYRLQFNATITYL